jgi:hypothetical protein
VWSQIAIAPIGASLIALADGHYWFALGYFLVGLFLALVVSSLMAREDIRPVTNAVPRTYLAIVALVITWGLFAGDIYVRYTHHGKRVVTVTTIPGPLQGNGAPESLCNFLVNGPAVSQFATLLPDAPKNSVVIAICGLENASVDIYKDEGITISKPYTFRPNVFMISVPYSERMAETVRNYNQRFAPPKGATPAPAIGAYLWFNLALMPKGRNVDDLRSLSDVQHEGGKLLLEVPNKELAVFPVALGKSK